MVVRAIPRRPHHPDPIDNSAVDSTTCERPSGKSGSWDLRNESRREFVAPVDSSAMSLGLDADAVAAAIVNKTKTATADIRLRRRDS